ncbi:LysE family transporter [Planctomycetota bacterium]
MIQFLITAIVISLSGVLAPGPMTAATLAAGTRSRHAGAIIALGHAVIEFPLMLIIVAGAGKAFELAPVRLSIGIAGGLFLLLMGVQLLLAARKEVTDPEGGNGRHPFVTGIVLTGANPYFLIWWATVGLALATQAVELGLVAFVLFAVIHWLCDLVWLEALSLASHKGSELMGGRVQQVVLAVCGVALLGFGCKFLWDAGSSLVG